LQSSFIRYAEPTSTTGTSSEGPAPAGIGGVDVNANLLSNLLSSYDGEVDAASSGWSNLHAGPVTAIMSSMGISLPTNADRNAK
jgi:hypothetical protein